MQQVSLYFNTKIAGKRVSKNIIQLISFNYYKEKFAKQIDDICFLKIGTVYKIISRAEKQGRLDLKGSTVKPKKLTQLIERVIIITVYDSLQSSMRGLALQVENDLELRVSHETIRNALTKHKYSLRVVRKKKTPAVSIKCRKVQNIEDDNAALS